MKPRCLLLALCIIGLNTALLAQEYAVDEGASFLSGMGSFTSQGGDLFSNSNGESATTISLLASYNYFVVQNFFIGGGIELSRQAQGNYSVTGLGIGPQLGYAVGGETSTSFPYVSAGIRYYDLGSKFNANSSKASGTDIFFGLGTLIALGDHAGLALEGNYHILNLTNQNTQTAFSGNIISLAIGVVGLLY